jgi:5-methylcytosine-specific restriction protein B
MQTQFQYITEQAKKYRQVADQPATLFKAINEIPQTIVEDIHKEYGDPESNFQPVNLLRAEIARQLMDGVTINENLVEEIKEKIRNKELTYFPHLRKAFLDELETYQTGKRDMFANWQKPWNVFHTFFYRGKEKDTIQNYLEQIAKDLLIQLDLKDYTYHIVDFQGATNFGSDFCWTALYPVTKVSHKESYQFFMRLSAEPEAGMMAGFSIRDAKSKKLKRVDSYDEALAYLKELKPEIVKLNNESRNYFKFAPGSQASEWSRFYADGPAHSQENVSL